MPTWLLDCPCSDYCTKNCGLDDCGDTLVAALRRQLSVKSTEEGLKTEPKESRPYQCTRIWRLYIICRA